MNMPLSWFIGLPVATWAVYLTDHIFDISKIHSIQLTPRHRFILSQRKVIVGLIICLLVVCTLLIMQNKSMPVFYGAVLSIPFIGGYFALTFYSQSRFQWLFNKELLVAFVYTLSVYATLMLSNENWQYYMPACISLFIICYVNLLMMSILEMKHDIASHRFSWALVLGRKYAERLLTGVCISGCCFIGYAIVAHFHTRMLWLLGVYLIMLLTHVSLYILHKFGKETEYIRKWSELIFWLPLFITLQS